MLLLLGVKCISSAHILCPTGIGTLDVVNANALCGTIVGSNWRQGMDQALVRWPVVRRYSADTCECVASHYRHHPDRHLGQGTCVARVNETHMALLWRGLPLRSAVKHSPTQPSGCYRHSCSADGANAASTPWWC